MRLILIRHGQTSSNVLRLLDTAPPGPGLTDLGVAQAGAVPTALAEEPIDVLYASTARRAQETAQPLALARGLKVEIRHGAREIAAGDWEMSGEEELVCEYLSTLGRWMNGDLAVRTPGAAGESGQEVLDRFDEIVAEIATAGVGAAAIVAHGAIIRVWASCRTVTVPAGFGARNPLYNTGIVILDSGSDGWILRSWSGAELEPGLI